jgi:hypothetical protein
MEAFTRDGEMYVATLGRSVCTRVVLLCDQVIGAIAEPDSPSVQRLFPDASADEAVATEFRRLTEADARQEKTDRLLWLQTVCDDPAGDIRVSLTESNRFLAAINDLRLVLGEWLGLSNGDLPPSGLLSRVYGRAMYDLLTWLQDSLVEELLADLAETDDS